MLTRRLSLVDSQMDAKEMTVVLLAVFLACLAFPPQSVSTHTFIMFFEIHQIKCAGMMWRATHASQATVTTW